MSIITTILVVLGFYSSPNCTLYDLKTNYVLSDSLGLQTEQKEPHRFIFAIHSGEEDGLDELNAFVMDATTRDEFTKKTLVQFNGDTYYYGASPNYKVWLPKTLEFVIIEYNGVTRKYYNKTQKTSLET